MKSGGWYTTDSVIISRPLREYSGVPVPAPHYQRTEFWHLYDTDSNEDQIIHEERLEASPCKLMEEMLGGVRDYYNNNYNNY